MEAHNCEYAGVHVPCEIVMRLGDLGAEYVREQEASFSTPGLEILPPPPRSVALVSPSPDTYTLGLVLDGEIGAARSPAFSGSARPGKNR